LTGGSGKAMRALTGDTDGGQRACPAIMTGIVAWRGALAPGTSVAWQADTHCGALRAWHTLTIVLARVL